MKRRDFLNAAMAAGTPAFALAVFPVDYVVPPEGIRMPPPQGWLTVTVTVKGDSFKAPLFDIGALLLPAVGVPLEEFGVTQDEIVNMHPKDS